MGGHPKWAGWDGGFNATDAQHHDAAANRRASGFACRKVQLAPLAADRENRSPHSRRDRSTRDGNDMLKAATAAGRMLGLETQPVTGLEAMR
jgi:hypothetical protein